MPLEYNQKQRYKMEDLLDVMRLLRSDDGCDWDKVQTHQSIRSNFLEETHEAIEAINVGDAQSLCEELGDVLLQIVFHSQIEKESGVFDFDDVVDGICKKLIKRHPHVFKDVHIDDKEEILRNWDKIKRQTKGGSTQADLLRSVPKTLPALMRSAKVQSRAARVGFDWPDITGALQALDSERQELEKAIAEKKPQNIEEELGDLLFSAVNVSRFVNCDAEQALTSACDKFIHRFELVESMAEKQGLDMAGAGLQELDKLWQKAKVMSKTCGQDIT